MSSFNVPPPPPTSLQGMQQHHPYTTHGSIGAVIGVLAVVFVLGGVAVFVGRLCSGRPIMGQTRAHYDMESWVESKCSSCVDGRLFYPPPQQPQPPQQQPQHQPQQQPQHQTQQQPQHQPQQQTAAAANDDDDDSREELPIPQQSNNVGVHHNE